MSSRKNKAASYNSIIWDNVCSGTEMISESLRLRPSLYMKPMSIGRKIPRYALIHSTVLTGAIILCGLNLFLFLPSLKIWNPLFTPLHSLIHLNHIKSVFIRTRFKNCVKIFYNGCVKVFQKFIQMLPFASPCEQQVHTTHISPCQTSDVTDLEDWGPLFQGNEEESEARHSIVQTRVWKTISNATTEQLCLTTPLQGNNVFFLPEQHFVFVKSFGCSHNTSDTEYMIELSKGKVDYVVCSCTVKNPSQDAMMNAIKKAQSLQKHVVIAGCVPQADRNLKGLEHVSLIGTEQITKILDVFDETIKGNRVIMLEKGELPTLNIPKIRRNRLIEIIPISTGCLGACTYCKTRYARGRLGSYAPDAILKRIESATNEGVQQIWLTSEDVGAYGLDLNTNIAILLKKCLDLLSTISKDTGKRLMLRIGMTNPPYMKQHIAEIASALNHKHCFRFIHIPVQSGSTHILKKMVRDYTINDFEELVDELLLRVPHITIATDIICGFPTESDSDHALTLDLISKYKFPCVNISQFYPRPGTPASKMKRISTKVVKERSSQVTNLFHSYKCTDFLLHSYQRVWFTEYSQTLKQNIGHTIHYIKVVVNLETSLEEQNAWVHITMTEKWHVQGELLPVSLENSKKFEEYDEMYTEIEKQALLQL